MRQDPNHSRPEESLPGSPLPGRSSSAALPADTAWTDDEIVFKDFTPDTNFVFDRMTERTLAAVAAAPGELILDVACGRAIDALALAEQGAQPFGIEASQTMIGKAYELLAGNRERVILVRSLAEALPFPDHAFDKVVCKGAMDHFADLEQSLAEMARVIRPGGRLIIAIANFESLTCRLGRFIYGLREKLTGQGPPGERPFWEPPPDHNFKFDLLRNLMSRHCRIESVTGVSLLWGFPGWGAWLKKIPGTSAQWILSSLDLLARTAPGLADVIVVRGIPHSSPADLKP